MINLFLIYYVFGYYPSIFFLIFCLLVSIYLKYFISLFYNNKKDENGKTIHENYPGFRRTDKPPSFLRIYLGLISFAFIKAFLIAIIPVIEYIILKIIVKGKPPSEVIKDHKLCKRLVYYNSRSTYYMSKVSGILFPKTITLKEKATEVFKKYLGPDFNYKESLKSNNFATVICNHIGWIDILYLCNITRGIFAAKQSVSRMPVVGELGLYSNSVFINREGKKEERDISIKQIEERQSEIIKTNSETKIIMFPEGTGNNNTGLCLFKKGPFAKLFPVKMYLILVRDINNDQKSNEGGEFNMAASATNTYVHMLLSFCYLYHSNFTCVDLPVFTPNEYLFKNYSHLGKSESDIYTEACRRVMSEIGNFELRNEDYLKKLEYISKVLGKTVKST